MSMPTGVANMEENSAYILDIKRVFKLSTQLSMVLELLLTKHMVRADDLKPLFSTFHGDRPHHNADRMIIYRLRNRLLKLKVCILTQYGEGYYLKPADKAYLKGILMGVVDV
jgi:DNA-binding response OmpR family regulator